MRRIAVALTLAAPARAQSVEEFYRGKTVTILIGFSAGGGYDLYARLLARHLGQHIPGNPTVVVQNMPGAGRSRPRRYVYAVAPKDGLTLATVSRSVVTDPLLIGRQLRSGEAVLARHHHQRDVGLRHLEDLAGEDLGRHVQARVQPRRQRGRRRHRIFALIMRNVFGAKVKLVTGYPGGNDVNLAMERQEVDGRCGWSWTSLKSQKQWLPNINVLVQFNLEKNPDLPDVPRALERAASDEQRQVLRLLIAPQYVGRPFFSSPDIPADRKAALRAAFDETMKDPEFLAEAAKADMEISPVSGATIDAFLAELYKTPKDVVAKAAAAIQK